jgi:FKBP-type peptidyl-prolyl cis-trans isomerase FklB
MHKHFVIAVTLIASSLMLAGSARAQQAPQTPASQSTPTAKAQTSTPSKAHAASAAKSPSALALKTQKDKASYAIGLNVGKGLHRDSVDVDPAIVARGLKDGLTGAKPLLTDDEMQSVMTALQTDVRQKQQAKMQVAGDANKKAGDAFLAANKTKPGVVVLPDGLQYKVLKEGTGPKPTAADSIVCNYRGTLLDNTEFDSSAKHGQPLTYQVGKFIKGWSEALQLMPVGSKWQLFIPSDLAYGEKGAGGDIGPNSTLIFEIELLSIKGK